MPTSLSVFLEWNRGCILHEESQVLIYDGAHSSSKMDDELGRGLNFVLHSLVMPSREIYT